MPRSLSLPATISETFGKIRRFRDSCEKIVHAFITSRLDLNNALLAGLPGDTVAKLQKCQNIAARVVTRTCIRDHIKPVLMYIHWLPVEQRIQYKLLIQVYKALNGLAPEYIADLLHDHIKPVLMNIHWLPVEQRIQYKLLIQVYKALNGLAPEYIADLLHEYVPTRALRSAGANLLLEWGALPTTIKTAASLASFKIGLKTYLFKAFPLAHLNILILAELGLLLSSQPNIQSYVFTGVMIVLKTVLQFHWHPPITLPRKSFSFHPPDSFPITGIPFFHT